ncbi:MAG: histidinol-phosphate transaminase, partial [Bacteroidota bacterium]
KLYFMSNKMDRRKLLKTGLLMAGGLSAAPALLNKLAARPVNTCYGPYEFASDKSVILGAPVELKARLFANENPFGPSSKAKQAIDEALAQSYQYPFIFAKDLFQKIADFEGMKTENLMMGAGSSPLLMAAAINFSQKPGSNIVTGDPTYEDLPHKATLLNTQWKKIPLTSEYKLDLDAMEKAIDGNTSMVYVCNPNNPTATVLDIDKLKAFVDRVSTRVTVFIDEAYIDYLDDPKAHTMMSAVKTGKNVIIARTFSKLYGFAGLRVGYVFAQPDMIKKLSLYTEGPNSLSTTSLHAAMAGYQDQDYMKEALQKTFASKNFLYETLKKEGYDFVPSYTNFVIFPLKMDSLKFVDEMSKRGVGVRSWQFNNKEWCRISIGRMDEMEAFAAAFKEIS